MNRILAPPVSVSRANRLIRTPAREPNAVRLAPTIVFFSLHIPLALLMYKVPSIATMHALATVILGLILASSGRRIERVAYVAAYIVGAEVLWRMTDALVFYEFGKYATAAIFIVALLRVGRLKGPILPLLYFLLLLPSAVLTTEDLSLEMARRRLSFNLSGPFALMVCCWFFSHLKLSRGQLQRLFLAVIAPVVGIAAVAFYSTLTASSLHFSESSNFITSGGFGPNQVSSILGLGALLALLFYVLSDERSWHFKVLMFGIIIIFGSQSALTFSRGGLYMAAASAGLASFYLFRDRRSRAKIILVAGLLFAVVNFILLPRLDAFTGGTLSRRFQDLDPTGRDRIISADLLAWKENPIFGVGPGKSASYHSLFFAVSAAHTEFTRLLAEHGSLGLVAFVLLLTTGVQRFRRARTPPAKALAASLLGWSCLFMLVNAMRLVAPAFAFGLSFAMLLPEESL